MSILDPIALTADRTPGAWIDGVWQVTGGSTTIVFTGSRPQPVGPEILDRLPEGARSAARFVTYVEDDQPDLQTLDDAGATTADRVNWNGESLLVFSIEDWKGVALGHRAYVLLEVAEDEE